MLTPSGTIAGRFTISDPDDSGTLVDADSLPTGAMLENTAVDGAVTVTIANISTGIYSYSATVPADWTAGTNVGVQITATLNANAIGAVVRNEVVDLYYNSNLAGTAYLQGTHALDKVAGTDDLADAVHDAPSINHRDVGSTGFVAEQYWVDFQLNSDGVTDEYRCITWFFGADEVTSGITLPTIQVIDGSDDSDLIAEKSISKTGTSEMYENDAVTTELTVAGTPYKVRFTATIAGESRTFAESFTR